MKGEIYKDEGYRLMGAAFEVYNDRGYGLAEEFYQECLEIELEMRGITFRTKKEIKCFYKGRHLKKRYVPDLFVLGCLVVELKAVTELAPEHEAQLINYMRLCQQPVRLPGKLWAQRHARMEAFHSLRVHPATGS